MWVKNLAELNPQPDKDLLPWLQVPNNLGNALRKICHELTVKIISEQFENFLPDEQSILIDNHGYVRTILLQGDNQPLCYCRTAVTKKVHKKYENEFRALGMKLIGETMLYNNSRTTRSHFEFCHIDNNHILFEPINKTLITSSKSFFARRSSFLMNGLDPLLMTETFLFPFMTTHLF